MKNAMSGKKAVWFLVFGLLWTVIVGYELRVLGIFGTIFASFGAIFALSGAARIAGAIFRGEKLFEKKEKPPVHDTQTELIEIEPPETCPYCGMSLGGNFTLCPRCGKRTNVKEVTHDTGKDKQD